MVSANHASSNSAQKENYSTRSVSELRVLRHDKNTIGLNKNTATPITFIPRAHWNINS